MFFRFGKFTTPCKLPRLRPRATFQKWRAATFHFRPGGMFMLLVVQIGPNLF